MIPTKGEQDDKDFENPNTLNSLGRDVSVGRCLCRSFFTQADDRENKCHNHLQEFQLALQSPCGGAALRKVALHFDLN
jgi:hypothetical protein